MSIQNLLARYALAVRAQGGSEKTIEHTMRVARFFDDFMGGISDVTRVEADDLRRFIVATREREKWAGLPQASGQKVSATTVNTYTRAIKGLFSWFEREGIIKTNPLAAVRVPKLPQRLPKVMTEPEMTAVLNAVAGNPRETALLLLLLDSGITLSEVEELNDSYLDTASGTVRVFRQKTQKERYAYFTPPTGAAIEAYRFVRPEPMAEPRLFLTDNGYPLTGNRIQKILERVGRKAGLHQRLSPHKLRHSFATWSLKYGSNLEYIRIMLGHSDIRTTVKAYLHVADADVAEASKKTSPVVNLGIGKRTGRPVKPGPKQNIAHVPVHIPGKKGTRRRRGDTVIVIQLPPTPDPADEVQVVSYPKSKKNRKNK